MTSWIKIAKLKVVHGELGEEYKLLEKIHKLIKGEFITLTESYNQLKASTLKSLTTFSPNDACASNSIDYASLLVENTAPTMHPQVCQSSHLRPELVLFHVLSI